MSDTESKWEQERCERRRLRTRQRKLRKRFMSDANALTADDWRDFSKDFQAALREDERLEYYSVETDRYLLAVFNLMTALGFRIHTGEIPRVSGVHRDYDYSIIAFDDHRLVVIDDSPESLYTTLADVQPISPLPVLGLLYNSAIAIDNPKYDWTYTEESIVRSRRLASALALGYFTISLQDLKLALATNPFTNPDSLRKLAARLGLDRFLCPPIDSLPVFGEFISRTNGMPYNTTEFTHDAQRTQSAGALLIGGDVTQASPEDAINNPDYFFKELHRAKLLNAKDAHIDQTRRGYSYLRSNVLPFPLGQLLNFTCYAARQEVRAALQGGFLETLQGHRISAPIVLAPPFIPIEDFDSFAKVNLISPHTAYLPLPLQQPEASIKALFHKILGDPFISRDWGGEKNDIFTTRVKYHGQRMSAAFLLKGPSVQGRLTIARCGKNGDQIQRLFQSPADVFFLQFNGEIDEHVFEEARQKTSYLRQVEGKRASFCIVDGLDTARLIAAYGGKDDSE